MSAFEEWMEQNYPSKWQPDAPAINIVGTQAMREIWNAALTHAAKVCMEQAPGYRRTANACAAAIEAERDKP